MIISYGEDGLEEVANFSLVKKAIDHILGGQVLYGYEVIVPHKLRGQFVKHILPLVGNAFMESCHLKPGFFSALAPFVSMTGRWRRAEFFLALG